MPAAAQQLVLFLELLGQVDIRVISRPRAALVNSLAAPGQEPLAFRSVEPDQDFSVSRVDLDRAHRLAEGALAVRQR